MGKETKNEKSILKSKLFLKIFGIPYFLWFILSIFGLISSDKKRAITFEEFIIADIFIFLIWFVISYIFCERKERIKNKNKESILRSKFFLKLFGIPSICMFFFVIIRMFLPNEPLKETITWTELFKGFLSTVFFWFVISFVISIIVNEFKKNKSKTKKEKEIQYISKQEEKIVAKPEKLKEETKKETKKKANGKCLYTCESKVDSYEYGKMAKYFPQMYWSYVIIGTIKNLIITSILTIFYSYPVITITWFVGYQICLMIIYKLRLEHYAEKSFNSMQKKGKYDYDFHTEFYDDYFIRQGEIETLKINYNDIDCSIETDTNFYLRFSKKNKIIIIQKELCTLELINFIRSKFKNLENHLGDSSKLKGAKKYHNPDFIRKFMIILFIITIASLWGALWSMSLVNEINPQHGFSFVKNSWVFWCWLPIPILSIVLGYKYKNVGFKCTKNIVGGFIIGFLLLVYGSFSFFPTFSEDYSKIDAYRNIIDANLPNNGELEIYSPNTYFEEGKTNYTIINAYYDNIDVSKLVESIENSSNWILSKEIKSELKILIPSLLTTDDDAYYSIYNKTTNKYNTLPETEGNYEIYTMKYDKSNKTLEIHKFNYSYK